MKKYLFNPKIYLPITGVLFIAFFNICLNISLSGSKKIVLKSDLPDKDYTITIQKMKYIFPNTLYLNNIQIKKTPLHDKQKSISLPQVKVNIALSEFILKRNMKASNVVLSKPNVKGYQSINNLQKDILDIQSAFQRVPPPNIKLKLREGVVYLSRDRLDLNLDFKKKNRSLSSQGSIHTHNAEGKSFDFKYKFLGNLTENGISISNVELSEKIFYTKLRGDYTNNSFNLKGFALLQPKTSTEHKLPNHYLSDLDTQFQLTSNSIKIQRFKATLDNIPINLNGDISIDNRPTFNLSLSIDPQYLPLKKLIRFQTANLKIKGEVKQSTIHSNGYLLLSQKIPKYSLRVDFKNLNTLFSEHPNTRFQLQNGGIYWNSKKENIQIALHDLHALFNATKPDQSLLTFNGPFYGGALKGIWKMDNNSFSKKINSKITLTNINVDSLAFSSPCFSKIGGFLNSTIVFKNYPQWDIDGQITLKKGNLNDFSFLNWFAQYFSLPSAQTIDFKETAFNFLINEQGLYMRDISLNSKNITLDGYFNLNENDFVSSKFSLYLTRDLIKESARLKYMLKKVPETIDPLQFDFRLSGRREALNFQWLTSDSKERLMGKIPKFILRKIEDRVEDSIGDVSAK